MRRRLFWNRGSRPRVLAAQVGKVCVERSGPEKVRRDRVAVLAHWSTGSALTRSARELVKQLRSHSYAIVLVSTSPSPDPLWAPEGLLEGVTVVRRPNIGYDFGSWATGLDRFPWIRHADKVLLLNDSLVGPFDSIDGLLHSFETTSADVWGVTDTNQFGYHLQSYALGFRRQVLAEAPLRTFWRDIRVEARKEDVIWRYEIGLSATLRRQAFTLEAAVHHAFVVDDGKNPTILGWRKLLDRGVPFVKRELVKSPHLAPDGDEVTSEVRRRYGVFVPEWL